MKTSTIVRTSLAAAHGLFLVSATLPASAQDGVWGVNANGNWGVAGNWVDDIIADGAGNTADFSQVVTNTGRTVTLDSSRTIGTILFGPQHNWSISGANTLTLDGASGVPTLHAPINRTSLIANNVILAGDDGLLKLGGGRLDLLSGTSSLTGTAIIREGQMQMWTGAALASIDDVVIDRTGHLWLQNVGQRINDSASLTMSGAAVLELVSNGQTENLGALTLGPGRSFIDTRSGATLNLASYAGRDAASILRVNTAGAVNIASGAPANDATGIIGPWATSVLTQTTTPTGTFLAMSGTQIVEYTHSGNEVINIPANWSATDNVKIDTAAVTISANTTIHTLNMAGRSNVGESLTVDSGATLALQGGGLIVRGSDGFTVAGTGTIGSPGNLYIHMQNNSRRGTFNPRLVADNGNGDLFLVGPDSNVLTTGGWPYFTPTNASNAFQDIYVTGGILDVVTNVARIADGAGKTIYLNSGGFMNRLNNATFQRDFVVGPDGARIDTDANTVTTNYAGTWTLDGDLIVRGRGHTSIRHNFDGVISGAGNFVVDGTLANANNHVVALTADNTYTGATIVNRGILELSGSLANSNITVGANGTFQGGSGTLFFNLGASPDLITLSGTGTLDVSALTIDFQGVATGDPYLLIDYSGLTTGSFITASNVETDDTFFASLNVPTGYFFVHDPNAQTVILDFEPPPVVVIPEPGSAALLGLFGLLVFRQRRRMARRRRG